VLAALAGPRLIVSKLILRLSERFLFCLAAGFLLLVSGVSLLLPALSSLALVFFPLTKRPTCITIKTSFFFISSLLDFSDKSVKQHERNSVCS